MIIFVSNVLKVFAFEACFAKLLCRRLRMLSDSFALLY